MPLVPPTPRTQLYRDPNGLYVHDLMLESCRRFGEKNAISDHSCDPPRRITYAEYGDLVERLAAGLSARLQPGDVVAIFLCNCWEFCALYHASTLAGCIPTLLNLSYREREVRYQLENSGAAMLISDGMQMRGISLDGLPNLRQVFTTRNAIAGASPLEDLFGPAGVRQSRGAGDPKQTIAALPYSSGTTGL